MRAPARPRTPTGWEQIVELYEELSDLTPSPVVELNRAVALAFAYGPQSGLELVDQLVDLPALKSYHLLPSVRGDFLFKLGRMEEARAEFTRAADLTRNERERALLLDRARACAS
jgi:predicted RNA polymerase sigma factor